MKQKLLLKISDKYISVKTNLNKIYLDFLSKLIFILGEKKIKLLINNNPNFNKLEDLTPYISIDEENNYNLNTYLQSLKWGILNQNVKNIAISGSFGTGKSTILNLFRKSNPEFKILDISLGKFEEKNKQTEVDIETSIVQQILYFEKKSNLKDSRFERITYDNFILLKALLLILWAYSILYIFFEKIYDKLILINNVEYSYYHLIIKVIFLLGTFFILKKILRQIFKLKINKVSFSDAEFIPKENDISIINKHVDELIYFFEKTKTQIVFIEDIDRFEDAVEVFIKLRELNIIINNSKDITQKVTFVYAAKDELFSKNNEKTKFFDLIIPVIPIVDYSNSNTQFIKRLRNDFIENNIISEDIIYNISPYVNDMRSLINIINEFKTYYKIKSNESNYINWDNLFGLVVLKNIYPTDFKSLQNKEGIIYKVFENKKELYKSLVENLEKRIEDLKLENDNIQLEQQGNLLELRRIYISQILIETFGANQYYVNEKAIELKDLLDDQIFLDFIKNDNIVYYKSYSAQNLKFSKIENEISPQSYLFRRKMILHKLNNVKETNELEIGRLRMQINNFKNSSLNELLKEFEGNKLEGYFNLIVQDYHSNLELEDDYIRLTRLEEINYNYTLLKVLISNNYIDENYSSYISLFYPESITENDNNLKLRIIQNGETDFHENIDKVKNLIAELGSNNFKKEAVLNFDILNYLLDNQHHSENINNKLNEFINLLTNGKERSSQFIEAYIDCSESTRSINKFIVKIALWDGFWNLVYNRDQFKLEKKKKIIDKIFKLISIEQIKALNKDKKVNSFLNNYDDFLINNFEINTKEELVNKLKILGIKFNKIKYDDSIFDIVVEVMKNNLYKINTNNVNLFLDKVNTVNIDSIDYKKSNYSYLLKSNLSHLKDNINNNINEYIEQVLLKLNNIEEEYEVIKGLINNPEIKEENIDLLIEKLNFKILDISEIENERFWSTLVIWENIEPNWKNVLLFYESESEKIDSNLIEFLDNESNFKALSKNCINDFANTIDQIDEKYLKLIDRFNLSLVNSKISDEAFEALVYSMTRQFDDIKLIEKSERIKKLIELNLIVFNEQNLSDLKTNDLVLLIEANEKSLNAQYEFLDIRISRWSAIFLSNINGETKKKIFDYLTKEKIYTSNEDVFLSIIMKNLFDGKFHSFSDYFIKSVLESSKIDKRLKIRLLIFEKDNLTEPLLNDCIKLLGEPYSLIIQKEKFEIFNSIENQDFFKILKQHGFIKRTYTKDKDSILTVSYN
ncbi:hypothetical protein CMU80_06205 [Elizabethkingia anophelis]|nr:hypothetical protein [Elizabethkingia anophelis]